MRGRPATGLAVLAVLMVATACNTIHGAGQDIRSIGRVFSDHPDGPPRAR